MNWLNSVVLLILVYLQYCTLKEVRSIMVDMTDVNTKLGQINMEIDGIAADIAALKAAVEDPDVGTDETVALVDALLARVTAINDETPAPTPSSEG